jgi:hypothetical protein
MTDRRAVSQLLEELTACAARVVAKPHLAFSDKERIEALAIEIEAALQRVYEGERPVDDVAAMLAQALAHAAAMTDQQKKWCEIAAGLNGHVLRDLQRVRELELAARPATTDQDYHRIPGA